MFPSKKDIQFFYDMGMYTINDLDFFIESGYLTEKEKEQILGGFRI